MFDFDGIKDYREDVVKAINKLIIDEINYVNKLCYVYSILREKNPNIFEENSRSLINQIRNLKEIKDLFDESVKVIAEEITYEKIKSLSEIDIYSKEIISDDLDLTLDHIVEESDVNSISMEDVIEYLREIDDEAFENFISAIRDVNEETVNYIGRSIGYMNKNNIGGR